MYLGPEGFDGEEQGRGGQVRLQEKRGEKEGMGMQRGVNHTRHANTHTHAHVRHTQEWLMGLVEGRGRGRKRRGRLLLKSK